MNAIAKVLAPATLVLASFSASAAGITEIDYPLDQQRYSSAQVEGSATLAHDGAAASVAAGVLEIDYPTVQPQVGTTASNASPAGADTQRQAAEPGRIDLRYFA